MHVFCEVRVEVDMGRGGSLAESAWALDVEQQCAPCSVASSSHNGTSELSGQNGATADAIRSRVVSRAEALVESATVRAVELHRVLTDPSPPAPYGMFMWHDCCITVGAPGNAARHLAQPSAPWMSGGGGGRGGGGSAVVAAAAAVASCSRSSCSSSSSGNGSAPAAGAAPSPPPPSSSAAAAAAANASLSSSSQQQQQQQPSTTDVSALAVVECALCGDTWCAESVRHQWATRRQLIAASFVQSAVWRMKRLSQEDTSALSNYFVSTGDIRALWILGVPTPVDMPLWQEVQYVVDVLGRRRRRAGLMERILNSRRATPVLVELSMYLVSQGINFCTSEEAPLCD